MDLGLVGSHDAVQVHAHGHLCAQRLAGGQGLDTRRRPRRQGCRGKAQGLEQQLAHALIADGDQGFDALQIDAHPGLPRVVDRTREGFEMMYFRDMRVLHGHKLQRGALAIQHPPGRGQGRCENPEQGDGQAPGQAAAKYSMQVCKYADGLMWHDGISSGWVYTVRGELRIRQRPRMRNYSTPSLPRQTGERRAERAVICQQGEQRAFSSC